MSLWSNKTSYLIYIVLGMFVPIMVFEWHCYNDCTASLSLNLVCHSCWKCISFSHYPWMTEIMGSTCYILPRWSLLNKHLIHRFWVQCAVTAPMGPFGYILTMPTWGAIRFFHINVMHCSGSLGEVSACYVNVNLGIL